MATDALLKEFPIYLDLKRPTSNRNFEVVEGDTANRITVFLTDDGAAVNLDDMRVLAVFSNSKGTACQDSSSAGGGISITGNKVTIDLFTSSFSAGMVECELQIYSGGTRAGISEPIYFYLVTSAKFNFTCRRSIINSETLPAVSQFPLLMNLISDVTAAEAVRDDAESARVEAEAERVAAETNRRSMETARRSFEAARATAETARETAEAARAEAEAAREAAEVQRGCIIRGSVTAAELDGAIANGWYECGGGILLVDSPITNPVSGRPSGSFSVHQTMLNASDGTIQHRDAVLTADSSTWLDWNEIVTSPVRGVDYWTQEDIASIKAYVDEAILGGEW